MWVIDFGASHHRCNDRSRFSMIKKLSLAIILELEDDNAVTATHYGFVNVIQGYQVEAPPYCYVSTFPSIHQPIGFERAYDYISGWKILHIVAIFSYYRQNTGQWHI
jgi:hypothetical protein